MSDSIAAAAPPGSKFSFVFCSTKSADRHPSKTLLFLSDARRQRGEAEKGLCEIADANPDAFATWILRPSGIATGDAPKKRRLVGSRSSAGIEPPQLAKAVIKVACEGWKDRVVDNDALLKM